MTTPVDFAFVSAKLHGMRSRLYEGDRLEALATLRGPFEMMASVFPALQERTRHRFEQQLVEEHVRDLDSVRVLLQGVNREFFDWQLERYRIENLKVLLRGWKGRQTHSEVAPFLVEVPADYALAVDKLLETTKLADFVRLLPSARFAEGIRRGAVQFHDTNKLFFIEAGLDLVYFEELCRRWAALKPADRKEVREPLATELVIYDLLFAARARLNYDLSADDVKELLVTGIDPAPSMARLEPVLGAANFGAMTAALPDRRLFLGEHPDPGDLGELQQRLWERLYRVANRAFYGSAMRMGGVEGFYYVKRVELNNLIRVAELLRQEAPAADISRDLIRRPE